jgi:CRP-like cAMP-binding protein
MTQTSTAFVADPELLAELVKHARPIDLGSNRVLFRHGEVPIGVYLVRKGEARLTSASDGDEGISVRAGAGSLLGVPAVIGAKPYSLTAEAMPGAELSLLTSEYFVHLMHTEPGLAFRVLQVLAEEVRFAREAFAQM